MDETLPQSELIYQTFTCERCEFKYRKLKDYAPYLCPRCMRFLSKRVWYITKTIMPQTSVPVNEGNV